MHSAPRRCLLSIQAGLGLEKGCWVGCWVGCWAGGERYLAAAVAVAAGVIVVKGAVSAVARYQNIGKQRPGLF